MAEKPKETCEACGRSYTPGKEQMKDHALECEIRRMAEEDMKAIDEGRPTRGALEDMRKRGGAWAAYQNMALDSAYLGHTQFLKVGQGCTYGTPPSRYPIDTDCGMGWRYLFVGMVDLETGKVVP